MRINVKVQRHLVVGHLADDDGDWIFTVCRSGFQELLGRKLKTGEEAEVELTANEWITEDEAWVNHWLREYDGKKNLLPSTRCDGGKPETD